MINGIALPVQMPVSEKAMPMGQENSGKFGFILGSLSKSESISMQKSTEANGIQDAITELLQMTSVEDVKVFLQEAAGIELPEMVDNQLLIFDERLMDILTNHLSELETVQTFNDGDAYSVDIRELIERLETLAADLSESNGTTAIEGLPENDLLALMAVMHLVSIEGPKTDLTLKTEQQLHSLQERLKGLGAVIGGETSTHQQSNITKIPFIELNMPVKMTEQSTDISPQFKEQLTETIGQSAQAMTSVAKIDGTQPSTESQVNSRAEQLMRELQNVFKRANFGQTSGTNRISIKLYPEHLGQLRIELLRTNGLLTARILASNVLGKEMLESQLHQLRQAFLQQNIQVERIDISQMLTETPHHEREQAFNKQFKEQQEEMNGEESAEEEVVMSFNEYLIELEG